jgi:hypothetical protein
MQIDHKIEYSLKKQFPPEPGNRFGYFYFFAVFVKFSGKITERGSKNAIHADNIKKRG